MDSNNVNNGNQTIIPPPKDFWEVLVGEKILYKAKASGAYFKAFWGILAASICLYGFIGVCSSSFDATPSYKLIKVLVVALLATFSFLFFRYSYHELRFFLFTRYLATPTRLLIGIELPGKKPKTKVIIYWKDVTAIFKRERTYICLLNGEMIILRDREQKFNENLYAIWQQSQIHPESMDSNSIDTNKLNTPSPKDIWEVLTGEKILYKAEAFGAYFMSCVSELVGLFLLSYLIGGTICFLAIAESVREKLFVLLFNLLVAAIYYFLQRYGSRERELSFGTYLATPTRLLIGIELPGKKPKTKVIVDWKDVAAIFKKKRTYICLSNDKRIMLSEKEPNTYENIYTVWQQSRLHSENES